jgi:hypothetical protein
MKLGRFSMLAAAGVMTAGALIGGTGAGEASAASATHLCTIGAHECLYYDASLGVHTASPSGSSGGAEWLYPNYAGDHASISVDGQNVCLQIYHTYIAGLEYGVRAAACVGDTAEQWVNTYDSAAHRTEFISVWAKDQGFGNLCLTDLNPSVGDYLEILPCTPGSLSQDWGTSI